MIFFGNTLLLFIFFILVITCILTKLSSSVLFFLPLMLTSVYCDLYFGVYFFFTFY
ncbi:hypothetical protein BCR42DRAFT_417229, partial [Absidia repens]